VAHLAAGGRAVIAADGAIVLAAGSRRIELIELERVAFSAGGAIRFQVQNALAATAAAWAAGLNPALIARALTTFTSDATMVPGRFNVSEIRGVQLILDYGHNAGAMRALGEALAGLGPRRTILAIGLPGDRRDEDLIATIEMTRAFADEYVIYESSERRGRAQGETPLLLRGALPPTLPCALAADHVAGLHLAWQRAQPGDRLVLIVDEVEPALAAAQALAEADEACAAPLSLEVGA
jgi:cyanophycin synthetase